MPLMKEKVHEYDEIIIHIHHTLMKEYGWIPFEEFKKIPMITILMLYEKIIEDWEREKKEIEKLKHKKK